MWLKTPFLAEMDGVDLKVAHVIRAVRVARELAAPAAFQARQGQQHIGGNTMPNGGSDDARDSGGANLVQWIA